MLFDLFPPNFSVLLDPNGILPESSVVSFLFPDIVIKHSYQDLNNEQEEIVHDFLSRHIQVYIKHRKVTTPDGVSALIEHIHKTYDLALESLGFIGSCCCHSNVCYAK